MRQTFTLSFKNLLLPLFLQLVLLLCVVVQGYGQVTLDYSYDGPWQSLPNTNLPTAISQNGLATDQSTNLGGSGTGGSANFDSVGDWITVRVPEGSKTVSFILRAAGTFANFTGTFLVRESVDGVSYSTVSTIDASSNVGPAITTQRSFTSSVNSSARYIRFIYSNKVGNERLLYDALRITQGPEINIKQGEASISTNGSFSFGSVNANTSQTYTFTVENLGGQTLNLTDSPIVALSGTNASQFTVNTTTTSSTVAPGASTTFNVTFTPTSFGSKTATLSISNNDADENPYTINISGSGIEPEINLRQGTSSISTGGPFNFNNVNVNTSQSFVFTIENIGTAPLNLTGSPKVQLTGVNASQFTVNETATSSTVAPGASTTFSVTFTPTSAGSKSALFSISNNDSNENPYTVSLTGTGFYPAPIITQFNPVSGYVGDVITIIGSNFTNVNSINFNGTTASVFTIVSDTEIQVTVPSGATTGPILLTVTGGNSTASSTFTVLTPTITVVDPNEGYIGDIVTITGTNFVDVQGVQFNGVEAVYILDSETQIQAQVPEGATTGPVTVQTVGGTADSDPFTVLYLVPTITSFTPDEGLLGDIIIITGTNFVDVQSVAFNGAVSTNYIVNSDTQISAQVPIEATSGSITVTTLGGTAASITTFTVLNPLPVELISFTAEQQGAVTLLKWATASETDNSHFEVEMSTSPEAGFATLGKVASKVVTSSLTTRYEFTHQVRNAGTFYYRLKQVDLDGTFAYSNVVAVEAKGALTNAVTVAPNPLIPDSKIIVEAAASGKAIMRLTSMTGQQVYFREVAVTAGQNEFALPYYDKLQNAAYVLTVELNGKVISTKVVKQ
ncbi:choice-of-anchor D domain-containing protein [Pontibacter qinzhouensis]|uniref:Choice-of-anchor D domain-containing protein n=1 Tax=Pontibacter qinzhouensis TaxID=2603253 RepID=A0A5C8KBZ4_9BACT|nr:choice-of-anchor D domain-containing protein [Pontibacter qinzhouensis]TXK51323.1 choice-of-anchor D domain-containing protein [Pontibacter qinzhouensis]